MSQVTFAHTKDGHHPVKLDVLRLIETRLILQANSGGGKSYAARKLLEVTHGHVQQIVIDPVGEFNSLRQKFSLLHIARGEAVEPDPSTAATLAIQLLELGVSAIVDLSGVAPGQKSRFVRIFLETINEAPRKLWHPLLVFIDEAHRFAPEKEKSEALNSVVTLADSGRKQDFCAVLATQRFAKLSKDAATELQNKVMGLANWQIDRKLTADELGFTKEESLVLRDLDQGEFFIMGPAFSVGGKRIKEPVLVQVDQVVTPHGRAAKRWRAPKVAPPAKIREAMKALAALPKRAEEEAKTIAELQRQLRDARKELADTLRGVPKVDPKVLKEVKELRERNSQMEKTMRDVKQIKSRIQKHLSEISAIIAALPDGPVMGVDLPKADPGKTVVRLVPIRPATPRHDQPETTEGRALGKCGREILKFLAARPGKSFSWAQIGGWTGYSKRSSTFANAISGLNGLGLIRKSGKNVEVHPDKLQEAISLLGGQYEEQARSLEDWKPKLGACARAIFEILLAAPSDVHAKGDLADATGYSLQSSTFANGLSELSTLELLARVDGGVRLNPELLEVA